MGWTGSGRYRARQVRGPKPGDAAPGHGARPLRRRVSRPPRLGPVTSEPSPSRPVTARGGCVEGQRDERAARHATTWPGLGRPPPTRKERASAVWAVHAANPCMEGCLSSQLPPPRPHTPPAFERRRIKRLRVRKDARQTDGMEASGYPWPSRRGGGGQEDSKRMTDLGGRGGKR